MTFLVIVLCLVSERFLLHRGTLNRFNWFFGYANTIEKWITKLLGAGDAWVKLLFIELPILVAPWLIVRAFDHALFGIVAFLLNVAILIYCIGPENPFYTKYKTIEGELFDDVAIGHYLTQVNEQLFAVLFWYLVLGPLGVLAYRSVSLLRQVTAVSQLSSKCFALLDWLPVRMTALLYLLVGNFQTGFRYFSKHVFSAPDQNQSLLTHCAYQALGPLSERKKMSLVDAETLVEHAVIVFLVFLALCTMVAWF